MVKCPKCGGEIKYISAAPSTGNGIIPVEIRLEELITEKGRIARGYRAHKCLEIQSCTRQGIQPKLTPDCCAAYRQGKCIGIPC